MPAGAGSVSRRYGAPEPQTVSRMLARHRGGAVGLRRRLARALLLRLLGFDDAAIDTIPEGRLESHQRHGGGPHELPRGEAIHLAAVAHDALLEIGYEAAAEDLAEAERRGPRGAAADALGLLEAGPPSVYMGEWSRRAAVDKRSIEVISRPSRYDPEDTITYAIGREVGERTRPWRLFARGQVVHDPRTGRNLGWDEDRGWTLLTYHRTRKDALAELERKSGR